jgi:hypothetical protein
MGWVEFSDSVSVTPDMSDLGAAGDALAQAVGQVTVFEGPQFFVGPYVGLRFGE